jgi:predicted amidohydrolase
MRIGFLQFKPLFGKVDHNCEVVQSLIDPCSCDLLVLPELFNTGYTFRNREEVERFSETVPRGNTIVFLEEIARKKKMAIVAGFVERDRNKVYNSSILMRSDGTYRVYRKKHLYNLEKRFFDRATEPYEVFTLKSGVKIGCLICFDWIFPEAMRSLSLLGAQIICHSVNLVMPYCQDAMVTRALENGVFIITANRTGTEKRGRFINSFTGLSQIVSPKGRILLQAGEKDTVLSIIEIEPSKSLKKRISPLNDLFGDRRTDVYPPRIFHRTRQRRKEK